jgi:hypothetical protein
MHGQPVTFLLPAAQQGAGQSAKAGRVARGGGGSAGSGRKKRDISTNFFFPTAIFFLNHTRLRDPHGAFFGQKQKTSDFSSCHAT